MPLSPAGVEQMAAAMGRYAAADVYGRTGGNPFWAEQLLGGSEAVPWTVVESVTSRLDALPDGGARAGLRARGRRGGAAGGGRRAAGGRRRRRLGGARRRRTRRRRGAVAAARARRRGRARAARPGRARPLARRVAAALELEPVPPDRVARHWAAAGETERAAAIARDAAADLRAQGATRRAFDCFEIAARGPPGPSRSRCTRRRR